MGAAHNRAASHERKAAKVVGGKRVTYRPRFVSRPDLESLLLPSGDQLQIECKARKRLPSIIMQALAQAKRYARGAVPCGVIRQTGSQAIACMWLSDLARVLGIATPNVVERKPKPDPRQLALYDEVQQ